MLRSRTSETQVGVESSTLSLWMSRKRRAQRQPLLPTPLSSAVKSFACGAFSHTGSMPGSEHPPPHVGEAEIASEAPSRLSKVRVRRFDLALNAGINDGISTTVDTRSTSRHRSPFSSQSRIELFVDC